MGLAFFLGYDMRVLDMDEWIWGTRRDVNWKWRAIGLLLDLLMGVRGYVVMMWGSFM